VVISSQYRGANIWPKGTTVNIGKDEFGGRDVADVKALIPILDQMPEVDPQRIGIFGISRGGMMRYLAARLNPRIKAIVVWAGVTDELTEVVARPDMEKFVFSRLIPNYAVNKEQVLKDRSVLYWLDEIDDKLPILLLHGDADDRVTVDNSIRLAEKLQERGQVHRLIVYPKTGHFFERYSESTKLETALWFKIYL
jgi:dipeptidyl aminopeptidase/acylaminoacyl peptidase